MTPVNKGLIWHGKIKTQKTPKKPQKSPKKHEKNAKKPQKNPFFSQKPKSTCIY
jgi:hypothetical protein